MPNATGMYETRTIENSLNVNHQSVWRANSKQIERLPNFFGNMRRKQVQRHRHAYNVWKRARKEYQISYIIDDAIVEKIDVEHKNRFRILFTSTSLAFCSIQFPSLEVFSLSIYAALHTHTLLCSSTMCVCVCGCITEWPKSVFLIFFIHYLFPS